MNRSGQVQTVHALLLRSSLWGERDRLVTLFEPKTGVLRARAVSAAETDSKLAPLLIPPMFGAFTLARGHSPIRVLAGVEPEERFTEWHKDALHLQVAGVMLAVLEGLDAPTSMNASSLELVLGVLRLFAHKPMLALVVFIVKMLDILGLLGGETTCSICGKEIAKGTAAASPDMQTFLCADCYNRVYGKQEVVAVFVKAKHLQMLAELAKKDLAQLTEAKLDTEESAFILSLAEERLQDMLPTAVSALVSLVSHIS